MQPQPPGAQEAHLRPHVGFVVIAALVIELFTILHSSMDFSAYRPQSKHLHSPGIRFFHIDESGASVPHIHISRPVQVPLLCAHSPSSCGPVITIRNISHASNLSTAPGSKYSVEARVVDIQGGPVSTRCMLFDGHSCTHRGDSPRHPVAAGLETPYSPRIKVFSIDERGEYSWEDYMYPLQVVWW